MNESVVYKGEKPLYINHTTMNKGTAKEFLSVSWKQSAGMMRIFMLVVAGLGVVFGLWQLLANGLAVLGQFISLLILSGVSFFLGNYGYKMRQRQYLMKQFAAWGGDTLEKTVLFYSEEMLQRSPQGEMSFKYKDITGVTEGKSLLMVRIGDGNLVLQKEGFEEAGWEEVMAFLKEMAPPPPPKKKLGERLKEQMQSRAATQSGTATGSAPAPAPTAEGEEGEDEDGDDDGFDIGDDSWVDEMDAEDEAEDDEEE